MLIKKIIAHQWFALADLLLVTSSIILLELKPGLGGLPLFLAVLPWLIRACAGRFPFQRTYFDWLVFIFLITAAAGIWAAYDQVEAWRKFWLLAGGIFLFYALAGQPEDNHWPLAGLVSLLGMGIAVFFLLANDWQMYPAKIGLISQAGLWWMKIRPAFLAGFVQSADFADVVAGTLSFTTPFLIAIGVKAWVEKRIQAGAWFLFCGILTGASFLLAISRSATIALGAGLVVWAIWAAINRFGPVIMNYRRIILIAAIGIAAVLVIGSFFIARDGPAVLLRALYNFYIASDRRDIAFGAVKLIGDFPFTGGGLGSFAGHYSHTILEVPYFFITDSHNLFLDVGLEQGIIGMLAITLIFAGSAWLLFSAALKTKKQLLLQASFASLLIVILHGLVDDILYGPNSAFLLFVLPGIACAVSRPWLTIDQPFRFKQSRISSFSLLAVVAGLAILLFFKWPTVSASWYANLGAVQMAKIELENFPSETWDEENHVEDFAPVETTLRRALQLNPDQRTANARMGRIAILRREFAEAVTYLGRAHQVDPTHRGIMKSLAYSYLWVGQFDQALSLLSQLPEARQELGAYAWWWKTQGREDLSANATQMLNRLEQ